MKKRFGLILLLCMITVVLALPAMAAEEIIANGNCGSDGNNVTWTLDSTGLMTISGNGDMADYSDMEISNIPWNDNLTNIKKIIVKNGVTSIGGRAFQDCTNLTSIDLPDSLLRIDSCAFLGCSSLSSITIPYQVTSIGSYAFCNCKNLNAAYFEGDVPTTFSQKVFYNVHSDFLIYYYAGADNWTKGTWTTPDNTEEFKTYMMEYSVNLTPSMTTLTWGDTVYFTITANKSFSAAELILSYNSNYLMFDAAASTLNNAHVNDTDGTLALVDYGDDQMSYTLAFVTKYFGVTEVALTSALFSEAADAANEDLISAVMIDDTVKLAIQHVALDVTLPDFLDGNTNVDYDTSYTFHISDTDAAYYTYSVSATMGGVTAAVIDHGNGSYTIEHVTGPLVITASRTANTYRITFMTSTGDYLTTDITAAYGTAVSFYIPQADGYTTSITSIKYETNSQTVPYSATTSSVTIEGSAIIDNIVVVIEQTKNQTEVLVAVTGNGAGDAAGYATSAELEQPYTLTFTEDARYLYTVTAAVDGKSVTVTGGNGSYTIAGTDVTGDITFTVTKTLNLNTAHTNYLTLGNGTSLWLITHQTDKTDGSVYTYDGTAMYWSETYGAYCTLVVSETAPDISAAKFTLTNGTTASVDYGMDVNKSGKLDANDAQFVYNMYNTMYSGITDNITVEKYLRADVNCSKTITTEDAAAIVNQILNSK